MAADCAVLELTKPIGRDTGYLGWAYFDRNVHADMSKRQVTFKLAGYRGDRLSVQTVDHDCRIAGFTADGLLMTHACPMMAGDSGGPILLPVDNKFLLVGIDVGVRGKDGGAVSAGKGLAIPTANLRDTLARIGIATTAIEGARGLAVRDE